MADEFKLVETCPVCGGSGIRLVWQGSVNAEGEFLPPGDQPCPECESGKRVIGAITIPQLDDILDKCNDVLDKCNDIFEKMNE